MDLEFANKITKECLDHYNSLPKKGKPVPGREWTLLSAIVMSLDGKLTVVAMATGTKCLGRSGMSLKGDLVNDSHAEVLARRCFLKYLYDQIMQLKKTGTSDIINKANDNNQFEINPRVTFHFYTSHVPCGDASIIPKCDSDGRKRKGSHSNNVRQKQAKVECEHRAEDKQNFYQETDQSKQLNESDAEKNDREFGSNDDLSDCLGEVIDTHRTGAKCVSGEDSKLPGAMYHTLGAVRTKPGRGDPTLSVSCSDKLARWIACGLQGAMLSLLLTRPVLLDSVVVGGGGPYSHTVLHRALIRRTNTPHSPRLLQSDIVFPDSRYSASSTAKPCPSAILWSQAAYRPLEVCVEGKRQGATKKCRQGGHLSACKQELFKTFQSLTGDKYSGKTYRNVKASAGKYNNVWAEVKKALGVWTTKPSHLEDFKVTLYCE